MASTPVTPAPDVARRRRLGCHFAALTLFAGLAVAATWPLGRRLDDALPLGTEPVETVPLFNLWIIWWNADRAGRAFEDYWQAPIFHPAPNTFAFSEPQPATLVVAPLVSLCETPALAYNVYLLAALTLNGWSAFRLLRAVGLTPLPALFGGGIVEMLPFVHWQLGVLQLVPIFGVIWTIHALVRLRQNATGASDYALSGGPAARLPRATADGALLGMAFAVTFWMCHYYALFFGLLFAICAWSFLGQLAVRSYVLVALLTATALTALLAGPIAAMQFGVAGEHGFAWDADILWSLSAEWGDYSVTPWRGLISSPDFSTALRRPDWCLGPGILKIALAGLGLTFGLAVRPLRRWTAFCAALGVLALLLSRGPRLHVGPWSPYLWIVAYVPGFEQARSVFRFALFVQLATAFLAAGGLQAVVSADLLRVPSLALRFGRTARTDPTSQAAHRSQTRLSVILRLVIVVALGLTAVAEVRPGRQSLFVLPSVEENRTWLDWLKRQTPREAAVVCIPFEDGPSVWDYRQATHWMYWSTFHERRLANGYSGRFPPSEETLHSLLAAFPDEASLAALRRRGISYCIVRRSAVSRNQTRSARDLQWVFGDDAADLDIYRVR